MLPLFVQVGRYYILRREDRICKLCNEQIEDYINFIFDCKHYHEFRLDLYQKLPELLNVVDKITILGLLCNFLYTMGNYIEKIWKEHDKIINK